VVTPKAFPLQIDKSTKLPFDGEDWLFEIKHDGFRVVAFRQDGRTTLLTATAMTSVAATD